MTVDPFAPPPGGDDEPVDPTLWLVRGSPTHARILEVARSLPGVANKGDHGELSCLASELLELFVRHAEDERHLVLRLPPITARLIENGQQRIVDRLVSLVLEADLAELPCRCTALADELASLIEVQIISEEWDQTDR